MYSVNMHQRKQKKKENRKILLTVVVYFFLFGIFCCHITFNIQTQHFCFSICAKSY